MKFKLGDLVKLKSGGPVMTVCEFAGEGDLQYEEGMVVCTWFHDGIPMSEGFVPDTLIDAITGSN